MNFELSSTAIFILSQSVGLILGYIGIRERLTKVETHIEHLRGMIGTRKNDCPFDVNKEN